MNGNRLARLADLNRDAVIVEKESDLFREMRRKRSGRVTVVSWTPGLETKP
jgi:hypothetical protein